jgi:hypothetical protein
MDVAGDVEGQCVPCEMMFGVIGRILFAKMILLTFGVISILPLWLLVGASSSTLPSILL